MLSLLLPLLPWGQRHSGHITALPRPSLSCILSLLLADLFTNPEGSRCLLCQDTSSARLNCKSSLVKSCGHRGRGTDPAAWDRAPGQQDTSKEKTQRVRTFSPPLPGEGGLKVPARGPLQGRRTPIPKDKEQPNRAQ